MLKLLSKRMCEAYQNNKVNEKLRNCQGNITKQVLDQHLSFVDIFIFLLGEYDIFLNLDILKA